MVLISLKILLIKILSFKHCQDTVSFRVESTCIFVIDHCKMLTKETTEKYMFLLRSTAFCIIDSLTNWSIYKHNVQYQMLIL